MHNAEANQDIKLTGKSYHNYYALQTTCINIHPNSYLLHIF